jgi:hypothetical protein
MARETASVDPQTLTIAARRVLLDAATALTDHLDALVLVGAQAVYLRTSAADLTVAAYTSDGDLGLDPARLGEDPGLEQAMAAAHFSRQREGGQPQPGSWFRSEQVGNRVAAIAVDLLVPASMAQGGVASFGCHPTMTRPLAACPASSRPLWTTARCAWKASMNPTSTLGRCSCAWPTFRPS